MTGNGSNGAKALLAMVNPWLQLAALVAIGSWVGKISANVESLDARVARIETVLYAFLSPPR